MPPVISPQSRFTFCQPAGQKPAIFTPTTRSPDSRYSRCMSTRISQSDIHTPAENLSADEYYDLLNDKIRALYPEGISDERCHAATRNFIGFGKLLLEMKRQKGLSNKNDE